MVCTWPILYKGDEGRTAMVSYYDVVDQICLEVIDKYHEYSPSLVVGKTWLNTKSVNSMALVTKIYIK